MVRGVRGQRADQSRERDQVEELIGRVMEACRREFGHDDRPDRPDRKGDIFGDDRPDQIAERNCLAGCIPERLIFRIPGRNPSVHLSSSIVARGESPQSARLLMEQLRKSHAKANYLIK